MDLQWQRALSSRRCMCLKSSFCNITIVWDHLKYMCTQYTHRLFPRCSGIEAKQPNSAIRKCCRVQVIYVSIPRHTQTISELCKRNSTAHQERQENRRFRSSRWLPQLHWWERAYLYLWTIYASCPNLWPTYILPRTKSSSLVSVDVVTLSVIFPGYDSRL